MNVKQVIIVRKDLNMRKGKLCSQVAHASTAFMTRQLQARINEFRSMANWYPSPDVSYMIKLTPEQEAWVSGIFTKIVLFVNSEEEFHDVAAKAEAAGLPVEKIQDNGLTAFHGELTWTTCGIGPADSDLIDSVTRHLKLL